MNSGTTLDRDKKSCWPWSHVWTKWADKQWNKLLRSRLSMRTTTSTADDDEVGLECVQERRCERCGMLQLRQEQARL